MGRIRKHKLTWKPSASSGVVGYRLYWSNKTPVGYHCDFIKLGNVTEVNLSKALLTAASSKESIYVGISAVDEAGNESDIISLPEPYHLTAPAAPKDLVLTAQDDFEDMETKRAAENQVQPHQGPKMQLNDSPIRQEFLRPNKSYITTEGRITDNFGKFLNESLKE